MQFYQCLVTSVLLYSRSMGCCETQSSPLAVFQVNCLRCICGISLCDHVQNVVILNRCNTLSVESQLQGKRVRWLFHLFNNRSASAEQNDTERDRHYQMHKKRRKCLLCAAALLNLWMLSPTPLVVNDLDCSCTQLTHRCPAPHQRSPTRKSV